jgi:succinate dehydrogenase/fumarate reductase cytochrome b subunit
MTFYELLLTLHVLAMGTWFGSSLAILVMGLRARRTDVGVFSTFAINATSWAGRAHPAAGVVLLLTGFGMIGDSEAYSMSELWVILALVGLVAAFGVGGAFIGKTSNAIVQKIESNGGTLAVDDGPLVDRLFLYTRIELVILLLVITDMVVKPVA